MGRAATLWKLSVATPAEAAEAVAELLGSIFGEPAVIYTSAETGKSLVSEYFPEKPDWSGTRRAKLQAGLKLIARCGLNVGSGRLWLRKVRRENWAESWKRHFPPLEIGSKLLVKPSWSNRRARKGQVEVVLDPGLSFGTGQHPTTGFCLRQLVRRRRAGRAQSFLDVGTGSGILAIAAAKLEYHPVEAFDCDADALRVAVANARQNRVAGRIQFTQRDITRPDIRPQMKYSLICANLISNLLISERDRLVGSLAADGLLVLAGILKKEFEPVQRAYEATGLRLMASRVEREWRSGSFGWGLGRA